MAQIQVLDTGGTFGKHYPTGAGARGFEFRKVSAVEEIVRRHNLQGVRVSYVPENAKDSLDMNEADRKSIADWCALQKQCIVVHGTDTMVATAEVVALRCARLKNAVVLTGALQPASMRESDAELNFGCALAAVQLAQPGVYIAMGGRVYPWDGCEKNRFTGQFQPK